MARNEELFSIFNYHTCLEIYKCLYLAQQKENVPKKPSHCKKIVLTFTLKFDQNFD